jgi:hypothetical protein
VAAVAAAVLTCAALQPAARALAQAADPFPEVPLPAPPKHSNTWALVSFASGATLIAASFGIADAADRRYADYLRATDPARIEALYNDAVLFDRVSSASVLTGEVLIAAGVYLAFLRHPAPSRLGLALEPSRCVVSLRF